MANVTRIAWKRVNTEKLSNQILEGPVSRNPRTGKYEPNFGMAKRQHKHHHDKVPVNRKLEKL